MFAKIKSKAINFYPTWTVIRSLVRFRERWRYHSLVRKNGISIDVENETEKLRKDIVAVELFKGIQSRNKWLDVPLYPIGGAADYKLLYMLSRLLIEYGFENIIEFGAGQTTKILDAYSGFSGSRVVTVESDDNWVKRISCDITSSKHSVYYCPLREHYSNKFGEYLWYDLSAIEKLPEEGFNLILVDGPVGTKRFSRIGIVEAFEKLKGKEWVLLWDDLHRAADLESFIEFIKSPELNKENNLDYALMTSVRTLGVVFSDRFKAVKYYF